MKAMTVAQAGAKGGKAKGPSKSRPKAHYVSMGKKSAEARRAKALKRQSET